MTILPAPSLKEQTVKLAVLTKSGMWHNTPNPKYLCAEWEQNMFPQNNASSSNLCKYISFCNHLVFLLFIWTIVSFTSLFFRLFRMLCNDAPFPHKNTPITPTKASWSHTEDSSLKKYILSIQPFSSVLSPYSYLSPVHQQWAVSYPPMHNQLFYTKDTQLVLILRFSQALSNNGLRARVSFDTFILPQLTDHLGISPGCSLSCLFHKMGSP